MVRRWLLAAMLPAVFGLVACGDDQPQADPGVTPSPVTEPDASDEPTSGDEPTGGAEPSPTGSTPSIEVRDGEVVGGVPTIEAAVGDRVVFEVSSDATDVVHVHGFDHHFDVAPGQPTRVTFEATFSGQFEVELEEAGLLIAELEVR